MKAAGPVVAQLNTFSQGAPELGKNLAIVLEHLDSRDHAVEKDPRSPGGQGYTGLEALLEYVYDQVMSVNVYDANAHVLKVSLIGGGNCADYADTAEAKKVGNECSSTLGPNQAGINYNDTTRSAGSGSNDAASRSRFQHVGGDPVVPVTAPAPPAQIPGGDAGPSAAPPIEPPATPNPSPIQIPDVLPGQSGPSLPKIGTPPSGDASDQRTNQALLDYLLGH